MPNTRDIRSRIKSIKNTAQITKAMQLVAASKMKRAQDKALQGMPHSLLLAQMLASVSEHIEDFDHPFFKERPVKHRGIFLMGTDKGLCGSLNVNVFRQVLEIDESARFITIGRKSAQFLCRTGRELIADFSVSDVVSFAEVQPVIDFMMDAFDQGKIDTIEILYPAFKNTMVQEPVLFPLVPVKALKGIIEEFAQRKGIEKMPIDPREMIFEPDPKIVLDQLIRLYIKEETFQRVLESKASEHSARMVAMKTATDNAKNLTDQLTLKYNKIRQAAITQEILEISAATLA